MIRDFSCKETEKIFEREHSAKYTNIQGRAYKKLLMLDAAADLRDLEVPPGNRLEKLSGDRAGQYSIRINRQWRICFYWDSGIASNVEIDDYH